MVDGKTSADDFNLAKNTGSSRFSMKVLMRIKFGASARCRQRVMNLSVFQ
jgi:hypothetical protein